MPGGPLLTLKGQDVEGRNPSTPTAFVGQEGSPGFQFECAEAGAKADKSGDNDVGSVLGERLAHQRAREIALFPA